MPLVDTLRLRNHKTMSKNSGERFECFGESFTQFGRMATGGCAGEPLPDNIDSCWFLRLDEEA